MKKLGSLIVLTLVGLSISIFFSLKISSVIGIYPLRAVIVTIGIGIVCLSVSGIFAIVRFKNPILRSDIGHLLVICFTILVGLIFLVSIFKIYDKVQNFTHEPFLWIFTNISVGLIFISIGFLVTYFVERSRDIRKEFMDEDFNEIKNLSLVTIPDQFKRLLELKENILREVSNIQNEIHPYEEDFKRLREEQKDLIKVLERKDSIKSKINFIKEIVLLITGVALGVFAEAIVSMLLNL